MKIGITGANGHLGRATLRHLLSRVPATDTVAISRNPSAEAPAGVERRMGDFTRPETLQPAFSGLDRLAIIPTSDVTPGARLVQHKNAIGAAAAAGVGHVTFISSAGTRATDPEALGGAYFEPEQALMRSAREWTILRMSLYTEVLVDEARAALPQGVYVSTSRGRVSYVARDDVAAAAAGILATDGHHGAIYHATGPAALGPEEKVAAISKVAGQPLAFVQRSREEYRDALNQADLPPQLVRPILDIQDMIAEGWYDIVTGDVERLARTRPRSIEEVLAANLTPASKH